VTGGEDTFVTVIYALSGNQRQSRFRASAQPFIDRLLGEGSYLEALRDVWRKRTASDDRLPANDKLRKMLEQ
jgi:hypothetical protein